VQVTVIDRAGFEFLLDWLALDSLLERRRFASAGREDISAMFDVIGQLSAELLAPHLRASDLHEPELHDDGSVTVLPEVAEAVRQMAAAGIFSLPFDEAQGGLQMPHLVYVAAMGMLMGGSIATASFMLLTVANAGLIATFGSPEQIRSFAEPQIAGTTMGTMCLSEPQAGSSLADIRTRAVEEGGDPLGRRFRIRGAKMWISGGDHDVTENIVHLVLAKVPDAQGQLVPGTRGISLFIVPKILPDGRRNDIAIAGLNHKMGYRGLPNCAVNFGEGAATPEGAAGAIGWLVGEPGQGLAQMFRMMNEARTSVGLGAAILALRGYAMARDYARDRAQGRLPGTRGGAQVPILAHADVRRMLLAQKCYAEGALALVLYSARLVDVERTADTPGEREAAAALLALLTPVTKSWPSEWAQESLHLALQIHGGAGYTRDFEVELLYRDNRLNPIHEGTTGIQALDLLNRKIRKEGGATLRHLHEKVGAAIARGRGDPAVAANLPQLEDGWTRVVRTATALVEVDDLTASVHATDFLFAFGHAVIGWIWLEQALAASAALAAGGEGQDAAFLRGKLHAWNYFAEVELARIPGWLAPIDNRSAVVLAIADDEF
jgi:alkylation response protein AidB-like acyl-CoA dehydrogenase